MEVTCLERGEDRELCPRGRYRHFSSGAKNVFLGKPYVFHRIGH